MKAGRAPAVHTNSGLRLCQSITLGRDTSTTPIASASGKEGEMEALHHASAVPELPAPEGSTSNNSTGSPGAAWGWQSSSRPFPALEGQNYHIIFTFLRSQSCRARLIIPALVLMFIK